MIGKGNRWATHRAGEPWIESRGSGIRHYLDWRENVLLDHEDPRLLAQSGRAPAFSKANFEKEEFVWATKYREARNLPNSDLASENSEDAITWSLFRFLEKCPDVDWWKIFGFEAIPSVSYWPRKQTSQDPASDAYRSFGEVIEPFHQANARSEIDVLLATQERLVLVEAKWAWKRPSRPRGPISRDAATNTKIMKRLIAEGASVSSRVESLVAAGGYQLLRHCLYGEQLERSGRWSSVDVVYVVPGERRSNLIGWIDSFDMTKAPSTITWNAVLAKIPSSYLESRLAAAQMHRPATPRAYFEHRMLGGRPSNLLPVELRI
jgi:hypothetical protein